MGDEDPIIRPAPPGIEAQWHMEDDRVIVELADDLDEVTRQRYIREAMRKDPQSRQRTVFPLAVVTLADNMRRLAHEHPAATSITAGAVTAGFAAAALLPVVVGDGHHSHVPRRPAQAAPAPQFPRPGPHRKNPSHTPPGHPNRGRDRQMGRTAVGQLEVSSAGMPVLPPVGALPVITGPRRTSSRGPGRRRLTVRVRARVGRGGVMLTITLSP